MGLSLSLARAWSLSGLAGSARRLRIPWVGGAPASLGAPGAASPRAAAARRSARRQPRGSSLGGALAASPRKARRGVADRRGAAARRRLDASGFYATCVGTVVGASSSLIASAARGGGAKPKGSLQRFTAVDRLRRLGSQRFCSERCSCTTAFVHGSDLGWTRCFCRVLSLDRSSAAQQKPLKDNCPYAWNRSVECPPSIASLRRRRLAKFC